MKTLILGDTHGYSTWQKIIKKESPDEIIFLGDYFDCYAKTSSREQVDNFNNILQLKDKYKDNCILCLGNHDHHYMANTACSGWNPLTQKLLGTRILSLYNEGILVPVHKKDNILFSHAGVSQVWLDKVLQEDLNLLVDKQLDPDYVQRTLTFNTIEGYNGYGDTISQSPIWIRPTSLLQSKVKDYIQVVGHTPHDLVTHRDNVYFCDTLPKSYLTIIDGKFIINS